MHEPVIRARQAFHDPPTFPASGSRPPARNSTARPGEPAEIRVQLFERWGVRPVDVPRRARQRRDSLCEIGGSSGRKASFTQRERMVGITVEAPWPIKKEHRARRRLLDGLEQRVGRGDGEIVRGIDDHGAPAAGAGQAQEGAQLAHLVHANRGAFGPRFAEHEQRGCAPAAICRAAGWLAGTSRLGARGRGGACRGSEKARRAIGEGCLADSALAGDEPGMMQRAGVECAQKSSSAAA